MSPLAAEELRTAALQLTGNKRLLLVNSHFHEDHTGGDRIFHYDSLICTKKTEELLMQCLQKNSRKDSTYAIDALDKLSQKNTDSLSEFEKREHSKWTSYYEAMLALNTNYSCPENIISFRDSMILTGRSRTAKLLCFGGGHTESDLVLLLPKERIIFMGDLLFVQHHPWLGDGDPEKWKSYLTKILKLKPGLMVPGHGGIAGIKHIDTLVSYIDHITAKSDEYLKASRSPAEDADVIIPESYSGWHLTRFYKPNLIISYNKKKGAESLKR